MHTRIFAGLVVGAAVGGVASALVGANRAGLVTGDLVAATYISRTEAPLPEAAPAPAAAS